MDRRLDNYMFNALWPPLSEQAGKRGYRKAQPAFPVSKIHRKKGD